mmetsp:Transcript_37459/g.107267  ORF Transcript_37459/g.107267 Transcript_37459/m.107267 type:complete len:246 (+) Transcript_37459:154-891(+)
MVISLITVSKFCNRFAKALAVSPWGPSRFAAKLALSAGSGGSVGRSWRKSRSCWCDNKESPPEMVWKSVLGSYMPSSSLAAARSISSAIFVASRVAPSILLANESTTVLPRRSTAFKCNWSFVNSTFDCSGNFSSRPPVSAFRASDSSWLTCPDRVWCFSNCSSVRVGVLSSDTACSARFTAVVASFMIRAEDSLASCRAAWRAWSTLAWAFCSRPKTTRSSFSSRPCATCSFSSTCLTASVNFS